MARERTRNRGHRRRSTDVDDVDDDDDGERGGSLREIVIEIGGKRPQRYFCRQWLNDHSARTEEDMIAGFDRIPLPEGYSLFRIAAGRKAC